jgi:arylsulfatase A-like enzyme
VRASRRVLAVLVLIAMGAMGVALFRTETTSPPPQRPPAPTRPNILIFTVDTLRADHTSAYGYERETTPTLTSLAARGTRFTRAYSSSSWTVPAVASLLTGRIPSAHGVMHGLWLDHETVLGQETLPPEIPTIASALHDAGYRTAAVVANVHLDAALGFSHGFDTYTALDFSATTTEVAPAVTTALATLRTGDAPFLLWVHLIEPHAPYVPRRPIFETWWPADRPQYTAIDGFMLEEFLDGMMTRQNIPHDDGLAYAIAAYDSEIATADGYLRTLLDTIDDGHLATVFAADHGEEFHDHFLIGHGHTAFDEVVRVPLIVALPGGHAQLATTRVSIVDVLPTVLELAHVAAPEGLDGRSLVPATRGETLEDRDIVIETGRGIEVVQAIIHDGVKYGRRTRPNPIEGLFDLDADPHETSNLLPERADTAAALGARLDAYITAAEARRPPMTVVPPPLSPELRAQLEALGYVRSP